MRPSVSDDEGEGARRPLTREDVLGVRDVAVLLGLPRSTVHDLARRGLLPARRVGRRWLFVRERIEAALLPLDEAGAWRPAAGAVERRHNRRSRS
jgi:excisionase family DNA binding protein